MSKEARLQILSWFKEVSVIKAEYAKSKDAKKEPTIDDLIAFVESQEKEKTEEK